MLFNVVKQARDDVREWKYFGGNENVPIIPEHIQDTLSTATSLVKGLERAEEFFPARDLLIVPIIELSETFGRLASQRTVAANLPGIRQLESRFRSAGFDQVISMIGSQIPPEYGADAIEHSWLSTIWNEVSFEDLHVAGFNVAAHSRRQREFIELDQQHLATTPERIKRQVAENATHAMNLHPNETFLVQREAAKKTRHIPVRRLFREAPHDCDDRAGQWWQNKYPRPTCLTWSTRHGRSRQPIYRVRTRP